MIEDINASRYEDVEYNAPDLNAPRYKNMKYVIPDLEQYGEDDDGFSSQESEHTVEHDNRKKSTRKNARAGIERL